MKSKNSMRTLVIILSIVTLAGLSTAYAAITGSLTIQGNNQTVTNPDVYFADGYDSLATFTSSAVSSGSLAGSATISDKDTKHYSADPGPTFKTGKSVEIKDDKFDCTGSEASLKWTLPVKNYGTTAATLNTASTTLSVTINATPYTFTGSFSSGSATLTNSNVSGLSFDVSAPATLAAGASGNVEITPKVLQSGVAVSGVQYGTFTYTINAPYNQGT